MLLQGVGHDHMHHKVLTKIFLLNNVILSAESNKSHKNGRIMIIAILNIIITVSQSIMAAILQS